MNDKTKEFLQIVKENPELEIIPIVDNELYCGDDFGYTIGEFRKTRVGEYCIYGIYEDKFYDDREEFEERWIDDHCDWLDDKYGHDYDAIDKEANGEADKLFKKAILVYIG